MQSQLELPGQPDLQGEFQVTQNLMLLLFMLQEGTFLA